MGSSFSPLGSAAGAGAASSAPSVSDGVAMVPDGVAVSSPAVPLPSAWLSRLYSRYAAPAAATAPAPIATARVIFVDWSLMLGANCGANGDGPILQVDLQPLSASLWF